MVNAEEAKIEFAAEPAALGHIVRTCCWPPRRATPAGIMLTYAA